MMNEKPNYEKAISRMKEAVAILGEASEELDKLATATLSDMVKNVKPENGQAGAYLAAGAIIQLNAGKIAGAAEKLATYSEKVFREKCERLAAGEPIPSVFSDKGETENEKKEGK